MFKTSVSAVSPVQPDGRGELADPVPVDLPGWGFTLLLAALTALTALSIDMSLPALPQLQHTFGAGASSVQLTLSLFLVGYGIGQLICGFLSDRLGRRPVLLAGLGLFTAAGFACAFSPSLPALITLRLAQGIGASVGPILARAMVRDRLGSSREAVSVLSQITQVMIVAPLLAPTLGGYLLSFWGWPAIFLVLGATGGLVGLVALLRLPETLPSRTGNSAYTSSAPPPSLRDGLVAVFSHRASLRHAVSVALSSAGMFAYISASPFVFMEVFGVTQNHFGYYFALTAMALLAGATTNRALVRRHVPSHTLLRWGTWFVSAAGMLIILLVSLKLGGLAGVIAPMMLYLFGMGLLQPNATALAMEPHTRTAGAVSSVMGGAQTLGGALAAAAVGAFYDRSANSMAVTVAVLAALTMVCSLGASRPREVAR
jgi:DHA1 family bicyclomycin/chloramphenicol resistance-like MFS transporter